MNFGSTLNNLLKHYISVEFLLMEGYVQSALGKELRNNAFVERFKTVTLGSLTDKSYHYLEKFT